MKKLLSRMFNMIKAYFGLLENYVLYKEGRIIDFEYKLKKYFLISRQKFGTNNFYQNYPPLNISGSRGTICRVNSYNILKYLDKNKTILDIGGNVGFFSAYLSNYVKHIDIIEKNKNLTKIAKELFNFEKIDNITIHNLDFKNYTSNKRFDIILSLAIHKWVGMRLEAYLEKINYLMKDDGYLFLESHIILSNDFSEKIDKKINNVNFLKLVDRGLTDDHNGKKREFFILKNK